MDKIFITGSSGFAGSNLLPYLQNAGYIALGVSRNPLQHNEISYKALTTETWNNANAMVHLAGKAHDLKRTSNDSEYFEVNYELTKILYDQFLQSDALQFIYISSVKAVADSVDGVLSEAEVPHPITAYGKSKLMAEAYILDNLPVHKKVYILRPCMIHGPCNKGNLNLLYKLVSKGIGWPLGAFKNTRSFCSIDNLVFIIKELIEREDISSGIYNVADDEPLSTNELINLIAESQNRKPRIWALSKGFIKFVAKMGDKLHLPFNSERLQKLTESYVVSNEKIKKALNKPLPINSKEGLLKTFKSFEHK
jgi:nucleoside-diphosphate-sugar epimerase